MFTQRQSPATPYVLLQFACADVFWLDARIGLCEWMEDCGLSQFCFCFLFAFDLQFETLVYMTHRCIIFNMLLVSVPFLKLIAMPRLNENDNIINNNLSGDDKSLLDVSLSQLSRFELSCVSLKSTSSRIFPLKLR